MQQDNISSLKFQFFSTFFLSLLLSGRRARRGHGVFSSSLPSVCISFPKPCLAHTQQNGRKKTDGHHHDFTAVFPIAPCSCRRCKIRERRSNGIPMELRRRDSPQTLCGMIEASPTMVSFEPQLKFSLTWYINYLIGYLILAFFKAHLVTCPPNASCLLKSSFYAACCENLNTDLCFNNITPTACMDYAIYTLYGYTRVGTLTAP